jgi:hypothetical protein
MKQKDRRNIGSGGEKRGTKKRQIPQKKKKSGKNDVLEWQKKEFWGGFNRFKEFEAEETHR